MRSPLPENPSPALDGAAIVPRPSEAEIIGHPALFSADQAAGLIPGPARCAGVRGKEHRREREGGFAGDRIAIRRHGEISRPATSHALVTAKRVRDGAGPIDRRRGDGGNRVGPRPARIIIGLPPADQGSVGVDAKAEDDREQENKANRQHAKRTAAFDKMFDH